MEAVWLSPLDLDWRVFIQCYFGAFETVENNGPFQFAYMCVLICDGGGNQKNESVVMERGSYITIPR